MDDFRIRLLQFTIAGSKGGRTQYILNLWRHIDHTRFRMDFVTFSDKLDFEEDLICDGCKVFHVKNYPEINREGFISEFKQILSNKYDIIEIHTSFWKDTIVEELSKEAGIKKIVIHGHSTGITQTTSNNKNEEKRKIQHHYRVKERLNDDIATDYWACSEECADWLYRPQISENKIKILPNTIDTNIFQYKEAVRRKTRNGLGLNDEFVIGFVGRLEPVKNLKFLIDVFAGVLQLNPNSKLLIVGDGSEKSSLVMYVRQNGLENKVLFTGKKENVVMFYNVMDCFMLPSLFEGFPLVVLEAFCCGLRCAVSQNVTESICISDDIKRLDINNTKSWIDFAIGAIKRENREAYRKLLIEKGFDSGTQIKEIEKLYSE